MTVVFAGLWLIVATRKIAARVRGVTTGCAMGCVQAVASGTQMGSGSIKSHSSRAAKSYSTKNPVRFECAIDSIADSPETADLLESCSQ
jgi:hypothetical protein